MTICQTFYMTFNSQMEKTLTTAHDIVDGGVLESQDSL